MHTLRDLSRYPVRAAIAGALAVGAPAALLTLPAAPVAAQSSSQLDEAVAALRGISTMKANFTQTDRKGQTLSGELTLKRPGKIRFQYGKGADMLVVGTRGAGGFAGLHFGSTADQVVRHARCPVVVVPAPAPAAPIAAPQYITPPNTGDAGLAD